MKMEIGPLHYWRSILSCIGLFIPDGQILKVYKIF